jgi:hypothetical protein
MNPPHLLLAVAAESYKLVAVFVACLILDATFAAVFAESPSGASAHDHAVNRAHPPMIADLIKAFPSHDRQPALYALIHHLSQAGGHGSGATNTLTHPLYWATK